MNMLHEADLPDVPFLHKDRNTHPLSHLKFAGIRPVTFDGQAGGKSNKATCSEYICNPRARPISRYDKLASEKPGEELAPDSSIWRMYAEEAKEHDKYLVERRNKNLDTMLLFAGLFSAILTAFLVQSTGLLERNWAETSATLLLDIAQSQRRIEIGNQNGSLPQINLPTFKPSNTVRWINALWFMALALSLGAAMMAMLAKEWLEEFIAATPTHPHEYARERQSRFDALKSWGTLRIIDFLPTLLHFSLVLFTLGLITHLWRLDRIVAPILTIASAAVFLCYVTVVVLGAVKEKCPYRTRVSKYLKKLLDRLKSQPRAEASTDGIPIAKSRNVSRKKTPEYEETTTLDLRALEWLTIEARDPGVGDSAFQALAGLKTRGLKQIREVQLQDACKPGPETSLERQGIWIWEQIRPWLPVYSWNSGSNTPDEQKRTSAELLSVLDGFYLVVRMGSEIVDRLRAARKSSPRELAFCRGTNVARYAGALPDIYSHAQRSLEQFQPQPKMGHRKYQAWVEHIGMVEHFKQAALQALDMVWNDECPPFTTDAYAELTAAELRLIGLIANEVKDHSSPVDPADGTRDVTLLHNHTVVDMQALPTLQLGEHDGQCWNTPKRFLRLLGLKAFHEQPSHIPVPQKMTVELFDLRARYSRALCRAAFQLAFHSNRRAPIGNFSLVNLLDTIGSLGENGLLDSGTHLITHHPQSEDDDHLSPAIYALISGDIGYRILPPDDIGNEDALLAGLTNILGSDSLKAVPTVEIAAMKAVGAIAPKLIKQWVKIQLDPAMHSNLVVQPNEYASELKSNWERFDRSWWRFGRKLVKDLPPWRRTAIITNYLITITTFAMSFPHHDGICQLPNIAIKALFNGVNTRSSPETMDAAYDIITGDDVLGKLGEWLKSICHARNQSSLGGSQSQEAQVYLLRLLAIQNQEGETILHQFLLKIEDNCAQETLLTILEIMTGVSGYEDDMRRLLKTIWSCIDKPNTDKGHTAAGSYAKLFTHMPHGFECLRRIGLRHEHTHHASKTIVNLITHLTQRDNVWADSNLDTTLEFLKAILFVCKNPPSRWENRLKELLPLLAQNLECLVKGPFGSAGMVFTLLSQSVLNTLTEESERVNDYRSKTSFQRCRDVVEKQVEKDKEMMKTVQHWREFSKSGNTQRSMETGGASNQYDEEEDDTSTVAETS